MLGLKRAMLLADGDRHGQYGSGHIGRRTTVSLQVRGLPWIM